MLIMEYIDGETLTEVEIDRAGICHVFKQMLEILVVLERCRILHRNLNPDVILVNQLAGRVNTHLTGFSECALVNRERHQPPNTRYTAPEILDGLDWDTKADLFSLCFLITEKLQQILYEDEDEDEERPDLRLQKDFLSDPPATIDPLLIWMLRRGLSDSDMRPRASELSKDLSSATSGYMGSQFGLIREERAILIPCKLVGERLLLRKEELLRLLSSCYQVSDTRAYLRGEKEHWEYCSTRSALQLLVDFGLQRTADQIVEQCLSYSQGQTCIKILQEIRIPCHKPSGMVNALHFMALVAATTNPTAAERIIKDINDFNPTYVQEVCGISKYEGFYIDRESFQEFCRRTDQAAPEIPINEADEALCQKFIQNRVRDNMVLATSFSFASVVFVDRHDGERDGMRPLYLNRLEDWSLLQTVPKGPDPPIGSIQTPSLYGAEHLSWNDAISIKRFLPAGPQGDDSDTSVVTSSSFAEYQDDFEKEQMRSFRWGGTLERFYNERDAPA